MTDKISDKDKRDWENFLKSTDKLEIKDKEEITKSKFLIGKSIDLHGYSLQEANHKIFEFITDSFSQGVKKINVITGKGLRSKNVDDPYKSNNLGILKYSVPNFIKNNTELMDKVLKIDFDSVNSPSKGNFDIFLRKNPAIIIDPIGIKKIPFNCCNNWYNPSGAFATKGATRIEKMAKMVEVNLPIFTNLLSLEFLLKYPLYISKLNIVAALFKTLLKVLKTAPITMAAKTPTKLKGRTFFINSG